MFIREIHERIIPPNFLNSILTNPSLYEMFKNDFDKNGEYFQGIKKEEYLCAMLEFLEDVLFSKNLFHIYGESLEDGGIYDGKLTYIRNFYDDFLLDEFKDKPENVLKTRFFKGLEFAKSEDEYASCIGEFTRLYDYVFSESIDYRGIVDVLTKDAIGKLRKGESLSLKEFDLLCNYVKNYIEDTIPMDIVTGMLKNHAFKANHIFDREVATILVRSVIQNYLESYGIKSDLVVLNGLESGEESGRDLKTNTIYLDISLIDKFTSLNYIELYEVAFMEADILKDSILLSENRIDYETLKTLMNLIVLGVDVSKVSGDKDFFPEEYYTDLKASAFIKALRFFSSFGVNLFESYIASKTKDIEWEGNPTDVISPKEICLDQRFVRVLEREPNRKEIIGKYGVIRKLFTADGKRKSTLELIKTLSKDPIDRAFLEEYLNTRIMEPEYMIDDVNEMAQYKPKDESIKELLEKELKYILVDSFYYSLDSFIKLSASTKLDIEDYLDDLLFKVNCIKDVPLTHRFIDEAIFVINDMKQSI